MALLDSQLRLTVDGYDLAAERERYRFEDVTVGGLSINRGKAVVDVRGDMTAERLEQVKTAHALAVLPTTVTPQSPVIELGYPQAGHYVRCDAGTYFDAYLGVAQKLFDENHPNYQKMVQTLAKNGLLLRREINTDDFFVARRGVEGVRTPQDLAQLLNAAAGRAFPRSAPFRTFFSNSGTEAIEAGLKIACRVAHARLLARHGEKVEAELMRQLGIARVTFFEKRDPAALYQDYPFFFVACEMAFHGRTLGALNLTFSKAVHKRGFPNWRRTRFVPFNGRVDDGTVEDVERLIDPRPLPQILSSSGGIAAVLDQGRIPRELVAAFVTEAFQGEGGYRLADGAWLRAVAKSCARHEILLFVDEIQSFGRTGTPFLCEQLDVSPDLVALAKSAIVGVTLARADFAQHLPPGWHANTWGGGKVFDNHYSFATIDTYLHYKDPLFLGRTYVENQRIKGEYARSSLAWLQERHPDLVVDFSGLGGMWGLTVRRREELVELAWKRGLKLLGCGPSGEESRLRVLFLADVLTREIDHFADAFDRVLLELEG